MKVFLHGRLRYHEVFVSILNLTGGDVGYVGGLKKKRKRERETTNVRTLVSSYRR